MKPVWIHIGLAKTGTSSLQRQLFSRHPQIAYLGKNWIESERAKEGLTRMTRAPDRKFEADEVRSAFEELLRSYAHRDNEIRIALLSEEAMTGFRFSDPTVCARRARMIFGNARILLVIREPIDWLQSMYFFRLSLRFPETLDGFDQWLRTSLQGDLAGTDVGQIQIGALVDAYAGCFGAENLTVLRYEDMAADSRGFVAAVAELLGVDPDLALAVYERNGGSQNRKSRISKTQQKFLEKYRLVVLGRFSEYIEEIEPLVASLEKREREKVMGMMQIDFGSERSVIETRLRDITKLIDRACRAGFQDGTIALAEPAPDLAERVIAVWEPGARAIAARFNPRAGDYFRAPATR